MNYNQKAISCNQNNLQASPAMTILSMIQHVFSLLLCQMQIGSYISKINPFMIIMAILDAHGCHGQMAIPLLWFHYERLVSPKNSCAYDSFEDYIHRNAFELNNALTFINNILLTEVSKGTLGPHFRLYLILKQVIPNLAGIVVQDGSKNHINAKLDVALAQEGCPFRDRLFYSTDGIEMHYCLDLLSKGAKLIGFSPANASERSFINFNILRNYLILHDAGYYSWKMVDNYRINEVLFLSRAPSSIRPIASNITIFTSDGSFLESIDLQPQDAFVDFLREGCIHEITLKSMPDCRLIVAPRTANLGTNDVEFDNEPVAGADDIDNPTARAMISTEDISLKKRFTFYITNLPLCVDSYAICLIYRGRWPVEFNFLSYKSWCGWNTGRYYHPDTVNFICQAATFARLTTVYFGQNLEKGYCNTEAGQYLSFLKCNHLGCLLSKILCECFYFDKGKVISKSEEELFDLSLDYDHCLHNAAYGCRISRASKEQQLIGKSFIHNLPKIAAHCYINFGYQSFADFYQEQSNIKLLTNFNPNDEPDNGSCSPNIPPVEPDTPNSPLSGPDKPHLSSCGPIAAISLTRCSYGTNVQNTTNKPIIQFQHTGESRTKQLSKLVRKCVNCVTEVIGIEDSTLQNLVSNWFKKLAPQTQAQYGKGSKQAIIATIADVLCFEDKHGPLPSIAPPEYNNLEQIRAWYLEGLIDNIVRGLVRRKQLKKKQGQVLFDSFKMRYWAAIKESNHSSA